MRLHFLNPPCPAIALAALICLAAGSYPAMAEAAGLRQPLGATRDHVAVTDLGAARKRRYVRRRPVRDYPGYIVSPPPSRPSFGYGYGDNQTGGSG
ncbi:hypothetical protein [Tardiphaga sp.]|uniref:hypothetical protein n=1 Tax=Tardiphaga sp. TaxID=1926292 RepID=UPI002639F850|nr:hypothetical protein [Tardiphaga sp.]MDB5615873.1 hypothetical protein [Tardiphaga sp.]